MPTYREDIHLGHEVALLETDDIRDKAVTTEKLSDGAVTTDKIADASVTTEKIGDGEVKTADINDGAVTTKKIADENVTTPKIADGAVTTPKIPDGDIITEKIADQAVTTAKIHDEAVTTEKLPDEAVTTPKIHDGAVTTSKIPDEAIITAKIPDGAVTTPKIANGAVTTDKLPDDSVVTAKIADGNVTTAKIADGNVTTAKIADGNVTTAKLADEAITEDKLANGAVTTPKLADGLISELENITDAVPTKDSVKPMQSGGVLTHGNALDISELNATENPHTLATYEDLSAALTAMAALPSTYRKGGMSIKFVQSSDNKYVCYMLNAQTWTVDTAYWEKVNLEKEFNQLNTEINGVNIAVDMTGTSGHAITTAGEEVENSSYSYTNPIRLLSGQTIAFSIGTSSGYCALAKVEGVGTETLTYTKLIQGSNAGSSVIVDYSYTATEDCYVCITYRNNYNNGGSITSESLREIIYDVDEKFNGLTTPDVYNVTENIPLESGYYDKSSARLAVPMENRKTGLIILFANSSTTWVRQMFYKIGVTNFNNTNWVNVDANWIDLPVVGSQFFKDSIVAKYQTLACIKEFVVEQVSSGAKIPTLISVNSISQGNIESQTIGLNLEHAVNGANKVNSVVLNATASDYSNVVFENTVNGIKYRIVAERTNFVGSINNLAANTDWLDVTNFTTIPYSGKTVPFFTTNDVLNNIGDDFVLDIKCTAKDSQNHTYFLYYIDIDNGGTNNIVFRKKKNGEDSAVTVLSFNPVSYMSNSGIVEYCGLSNMNDYKDCYWYVKLNWKAVQARFSGQRVVFSISTAAFSEECFTRQRIGGLEKIELNRVRDLNKFGNGTYQVGTKSIRKFNDNDVPVIPNNITTNEGRVQLIENLKSYTFDGKDAPGQLKGLHYLNLSTNLLFLDITWDGKIWFARRDTGDLRYYESVEDVLSGTNYTELQTGSLFLSGSIQQHPYGVKMNTKGELIIVSWDYATGIGSANNTPRIWKSDSDFENITLKQTARTELVGFRYPDWLFDIKDNRILVSFYGGHYDDATKAPWHIYYSFDGGDNWYDNIFELGNMTDVDGWHENDSTKRADMHIHGIAIDIYRDRLMVQNGDVNSSLWVTTNLREWELDPDRTDNWSQNTAHTLHWKKIAAQDTTKYTSAIALRDCLILGTDSLPNGFQRINMNSLYDGENEIALSDVEWANQKTNADGTGDYAIYGYTLNRRTPNDPVICSLMYVGGVQSTDKKRNMVYATYDGYSFWKLWEDDRDVVYKDGNNFVPLLPRTNVISRQSHDGYVLIQTRDSRFNPLIDGYPTPTTEFTLVVGKLY